FRGASVFGKIPDLFPLLRFHGARCLHECAVAHSRIRVGTRRLPGAEKTDGSLPAMRYAAAIFLSAFLLFLVHSVAGKQLLPWFGGTATWAVCMFSFQLLLLAGCLFAWLLGCWC